MRVIAKLILVLALAGAVILIVNPGRRSLFPAKPGDGQSSRRATPQEVNEPAVPRAMPETSPPAGPPDGIYVRQGDRDVYVRFAKPDAVLGSYLQSLMDGSFDPNRKGKEIFLVICAACHQRDGEGKDGVAPPLDGSEWVLTPNGGRLVRIVLNGLTGPVRVRGREWNLSMPAWRANLNDDQLAVVLTYVRSQLGGNHAGPITPEFVAAARKEVRLTLETADGLMQIADP